MDVVQALDCVCSTFDLPRLPNVPMYKVLRFLDHSTLIKMRSTNSAIRGIIDTWKWSLVARPIHCIKITLCDLREDENRHCGKIVVKVSILEEENSQPKHLIFWRTFESASMAEILVIKDQDKILDECLFVEWLAEALNVLSIYSLRFYSISLTEQELNKISRSLVEKRCSIDTVFIVQFITLVERWNRWTGFLSLLKLKALTIYVSLNHKHGLTLTPFCLRWIPSYASLEEFSNRNYHYLRPLEEYTVLQTHLHLIPRRPIVYGMFDRGSSDPGSFDDEKAIYTCEIFVAAIETWVNGDVEASYWLFVLRSTYEHTFEMARRLNCPFEMVDVPSMNLQNVVLLTNVNGKENLMYHIKSPHARIDGASFWIFREKCEDHELRRY